jgi:hypothetical protein
LWFFDSYGSLPHSTQVGLFDGVGAAVVGLIGGPDGMS